MVDQRGQRGVSQRPIACRQKESRETRGEPREGHLQIDRKCAAGGVRVATSLPMI